MRVVRHFVEGIALALLLVVSARGQSNIPSYHQHADFLLTSPGTMGNGLLGYVNPAVLNHLHGPDVRFFFSDEDAKLSSLKRWGLFVGVPHLGFGVIRHRFPVATTAGEQEMRVSDYRLSFGAGDESLSFGLGYGWSRGDLDYIRHDGIWTLGAMARPNRYLSLGISGNFARHSGDREGILDVGLRPFGSDAVTVFGDFSLQKQDRLEDGCWSAGAALQPLPGIYLTGRYFESKVFTVGLNWSLGAAGISAQTHVDDKSDLDHTMYGIRVGAQTHNVFSRYLERDKYYLGMNLKGDISYRKYLLFDEGTQTLTGILDALEGAVDDQRVAGVALSLSGMNIARELAWEIREELQKVREAGKHVVIYLDRGAMTEYHLASVADRIILDPEGMLQLEGFVLGRTYLSGTLEKLGLGFDEWRFFKYKSAAETLSRENMSGADREQRQALLDDFYELVRRDICDSRDFTETHFDSLVNEVVVFPSAEAVCVGLVDTLARWTDVDKIIEAFEGKKKGRIGSNALAHRVFPRREWGSRPKIAVVYALGVCDMDVGINARRLERIFIGLSKDPAIRAVVLRADSPGGDGLASDLVAEAMRKCAEKKPVIVSQGSVAASGGYWISMNADTIIAAPNTITGSIGVIGGWIWNKGFGDRLGMSSDHVKVGKHADLGFGITLPYVGLQVPDRNLTEEERAKVEIMIKDFYKEFVSKVANGRDMDIDEVEQIAQGRVWSGVAGKDNGLVDLIGGLEMAIAVAKAAAEIPAEKEVDIVELPGKGWINPNVFMPKLFGVQVKREAKDPVGEYVRTIAKYPGQALPLLPPDSYQE